MKKFAVAILIVLTFACSAFAAPAVNVVIDGSAVEFTESSGAPFIDSNNRTLVPMRVVMEKYGCTVQWSQSTKTAGVVLGDTTVLVPIGASYITVNGEQRAIDAPAQIVSGRTYLPIRAVLEAFGAGVGWDNASKSVIANSDGTVSNTAGQGSAAGNQQGADNAVNSGEQMSYDEFIGLFDVKSGVDKRGWVLRLDGNGTSRDELVNICSQDYAKRYIYDCITSFEHFGQMRAFVIAPEPGMEGQANLIVHMTLNPVTLENFTYEKFSKQFYILEFKKQ